MPLIQEKTAQHNALSEDAAAFRIPCPVTQILLFPSGNSYPLCPRCNSSLEREYMRFCDSCGQRLAWRGFSAAKVRKWQKEEDSE